MKQALARRWTAGLLLGLAAVGLAGCDDAGTGLDTTPTGLVVVDVNGGTVASFDGTHVTGGITVPRGAQRTFEVRLVTPSGLTQGSLGNRYTLQPRVLITLLASATVSSGNRVVVTGQSTGTTSLVLDVMEGGTLVFGPLIPLTIS